MDVNRAEATNAAILAEQLAYCRARATGCDERWFRTKVFHDPAQRMRRFAALWRAAQVEHPPRCFFHGALTRLQRESS